MSDFVAWPISLTVVAVLLAGCLSAPTATPETGPCSEGTNSPAKTGGYPVNVTVRNRNEDESAVCVLVRLDGYLAAADKADPPRHGQSRAQLVAELELPNGSIFVNATVPDWGSTANRTLEGIDEDDDWINIYLEPDRSIIIGHSRMDPRATV